VAAGNGLYLVVWDDDGNITAQFIEATTGVRVGTEQLLSTLPEYEYAPRAAFDGTDWHVVWSASMPNRIRHQRVLPGGPVLTPQNLGQGELARIAAGPPGHIAVSWAATASQLVARRLLGGTLQDTSPLALGNLASSETGLAFDGQSYRALWQATQANMQSVAMDLDGGLSARTTYSTNDFANVTELGCADARCVGTGTFSSGYLGTVPLTAVSPVTISPLSPPPPAQWGARAAWNGTSFIALWVEAQGRSTAYRLRAEVLDNDGYPMSSPVLLTPATFRAYHPCVAATPGGVLAAWYEEDPVGRLRVTELDSMTVQPVGAAVNPSGAPAGSRIALLAVDQHFHLFWEGTGGGRPLLNARIALDGGARLIDAAGRLTWVTNGVAAMNAAWAPDSGMVLLTWYEPNGGIHVGRVTEDGLPIDSAPVPVASPGNYVIDPTVASDGRDFFVAWVANGDNDNIRGVRVSATGQVLDVPSLVVGPAVETTYTPGHPSVTFDGQDYLVAFELPDDLDGTGVFFRRVSRDGGLQPIQLLRETSGEEQYPQLTAGTVGRVLATYQRAPDVDAGFRLYARMITSVPPGGFCTEDRECTSGTCVQAACSSDGGTVGPMDGGAPPADGGVTDGGSSGGGTGSYLVSCGCHAGTGHLALLALAFLRRRRR
jgi:hypothetical protein